jgi:hypothetical protein
VASSQVSQTKNCVQSSSPTYVSYSPTILICLVMIKRIILMHMIKLIIMQLSPLPSYLIPCRPRYLPLCCALQHSQFISSLNVSDQVSHVQNDKQNYSAVYFIYALYFWIARWKTKCFSPSGSKRSWVQSAVNFFMNAIHIFHDHS